jgi:hypothetical protein
MRFGGPATADDAGLGGDESAVLLVAQTNGLRRDAGSDDYRCRSGRLRTAEDLVLLLQVFGAGVVDNLRSRRARVSSFDRDDPLAEAGSTKTFRPRTPWPSQTRASRKGKVTRPPRIVLSTDQSKALRDRLVAELSDLKSPDEAAD